MRISDVTHENYGTFAALFGGKAAPLPAALRGKEPAAAPADPKKYIEPGMDITGRDPNSYKKVDVSDDIRDKLLNHARSEFVGNYGMTDGEERSAMVREYLKSVPPEERLDVSYTLDQIFLDESRRLASLAKSAVPGWQPGDAFDQDMLRGLMSQNSVDVTA